MAVKGKKETFILSLKLSNFDGEGCQQEGKKGIEMGRLFRS
jgi:hypothetical protein